MGTTTGAARLAGHLCAAVLLALLLPACFARAAFEFSWPDARSAGLLTPGLLLVTSPGLEPTQASPDSATSRALPGLRVTVSAGEFYGVREAAGWGARGSTGFGAVSVGIELSRLGGELYEERSLSVRVGLDADPDLGLSVRVRGLGIAARGIDDRWTAAVDASVTRRLIGRVLLGAACENLTRSWIGDSPVAARAGFGAALVLPSVSIRWTLLFEETFAPSTVLAFEAALTDWLRVRAGARDAPGRLGFGFGVGRGRGGPWPIVDIAVQWHPELGVSSFVSVTIEP
ncbi:MAG: hypothetical protein ABIE42_05615 [Candidatus Eisenbacteria bacterium]